jgi:cell wall-associated NlpC family hydrolase
VWGGSGLKDPFTALQLEHFEQQAGTSMQPPTSLIKYYKQAANHYRIPWEVLAAINYIETDYGRDLHVSSAGAVGWMQFEPTTWLEYGQAVNLRGLVKAHAVPNPYLPSDAIFAAARLLAANGAHKNLAKAIYSYNHADWYVQEVLTVAEKITAHDIHRRLMVMRQTASMLSGIAYLWGGGHVVSNWVVSNGYDCSGFVSTILHAGGYLNGPVTTQTLAGGRVAARMLPVAPPTCIRSTVSASPISVASTWSFTPRGCKASRQIALDGRVGWP